jgi:ABC-type lipoprotein release transport system permease subunit
MSMVRFGLRNLFRSRLRLALVSLLIAFPFFLLLVMQAIGEAVQRQTELLKRTVDNTLQARARGSMGHVNMIGSSDVLPADVVAKVRALEHVRRVEPYLLAMTPTEGHNFAIIVGLNPGDTMRLESHGEAGSPRIVAGRNLTPEDRGKAIGVIGQGFARSAGITPENLDRATLTLDLRRPHAAIFALDRPAAAIRVVGMYASGYVFGDMQLFIPLDTFRDVYGVPDKISWLFVTADSSQHVPAIEQKLRTLVGDLADVVAPTAAAEFEQLTTRAVVRLTTSATLLSAVLMVIVVFFVMLLIVRERSWEIGTLKALGAPTGGIVVSFLTEAVALCAVGALVGTAAFAVVGGPIIRRAFSLGIAPFLPSHYKDTLFESLDLAAGLGATTIGVLLGVCVAVAVAGSLWSVRQIVRLSPLEAIRNE